jgi:PAS domain-containing protein
VSTIILSGVGALGSWALELLARADGVDRIITLKRRPWDGPSRTNLTMIGAVFQGHAKAWEHHEIDLADIGLVAKLIAAERPDAILHSATVQSPRRLTHARLDPAIRALLRDATFGMWLPWHLLPASRLIQAVEAAGVDTVVVNASFPDVVNPAIYGKYGHGPIAGAGNVEICVAQISRYMVDVAGVPLDDLDVSLVGSHALLSYGPEVPHHFRLTVKGRDVTDDHDLTAMLHWPKAIEWSRVDEFSLFAASAVKNVLALIGDGQTRTHVSAPGGLPGGYPVRIAAGRIDLDLPEGIDEGTAVALNNRAARWDGIERIEEDGTVVYTNRAAEAMAELGVTTREIRFEELPNEAAERSQLYERLTHLEGTHA